MAMFVLLANRANAGGANPFNFLFLDAGARSAGLAGAYTALAKDSVALHYNPAGLAWTEDHEATFMHNQYFERITQEYAAYASPWGFGGILNHLSFGNATQTTYSNADGAGMGSQGMSDLAVSLGYGRILAKGLGLGAGLKYIRESIAGYSAQGHAVDIGVLYDADVFMNGVTVGVAIKNMGPDIKFQGTEEKLPLNLQGGASYRFNIGDLKNTMVADISRERNEPAIFASGLESVILKSFPIRLGYSTRNQAGLGVTAGMGYRHKIFGVDYAFAPYGNLGSVHRISLTIKWGQNKY